MNYGQANYIMQKQQIKQQQAESLRIEAELASMHKAFLSTQALMTDIAQPEQPAELCINHEEAKSLAYLKRQESNLARCYLDMTAERDEYKLQYEDLLFQVSQKFKDETRHETAKRYIASGENQSLQSKSTKQSQLLK